MTLDKTTTRTAPPTPGTPRLRMEPTGSRRTLLDGGWWPRSTDPAAELPDLIPAIDKLRGPITQLVLSAAGWETHPRRLQMAGRVLRLGYFHSQSAALLTALCDNGDRVDLLVVPVKTGPRTADTAMRLAATTSNRIHAHQLVAAASDQLDQPTGTPKPSTPKPENFT